MLEAGRTAAGLKVAVRAGEECAALNGKALEVVDSLPPGRAAGSASNSILLKFGRLDGDGAVGVWAGAADAPAAETGTVSPAAKVPATAAEILLLLLLFCTSTVPHFRARTTEATGVPCQHCGVTGGRREDPHAMGS